MASSLPDIACELNNYIIRANNPVFFTGGGTSYASGIPLLHGNRGDIDSHIDNDVDIPRWLLSAPYFQNNPTKFWNLYLKYFVPKLINNGGPNSSHYYPIKHNIPVYTYNIDDLYEQAYHNIYGETYMDWYSNNAGVCTKRVTVYEGMDFSFDWLGRGRYNDSIRPLPINHFNGTAQDNWCIQPHDGISNQEIRYDITQLIALCALTGIPRCPIMQCHGIIEPDFITTTKLGSRGVVDPVRESFIRRSLGDIAFDLIVMIGISGETGDELSVLELFEDWQRDSPNKTTVININPQVGLADKLADINYHVPAEQIFDLLM